MQPWRLATILSLFCHVLPTSSTSSTLRSRAQFRRKLKSWKLHPWEKAGSDLDFPFSPKAQELDTFSVIVWGATLRTRSDTKHHQGLFCILRYGPAKTSWDQKVYGTGRISNTSKPLEVSPTWNLGTLVTGSDKTEVSVRVFALDEANTSLPELRGKQLYIIAPGTRRLLGEISVSISTLQHASRNSVDGKASFKLPGGGHVRLTAAHGGVAPSFALGDYGVSPSTRDEPSAPIAGQQAARVEDINGHGPLILGTSPLPAALQGIWWVAGQPSGSSLFSFGGPNNDGNGCSLGYISAEKNSYKVRAEGDRVIATSEPTGLEKLLEAGDMVYYFEFDNAVDPRFGHISMLFEGLGIGEKDRLRESIMNSQMHLLPNGDLEYPGSLVWLRNTTFWGVNAVGDTKLVQVMDGTGAKIEPAWSKFVAAEKDVDNRNYPGWMFYKSVSPATSPWAIAVIQVLMQRVRVHAILIMAALLSLAGALFAACTYGFIKAHRTLRRHNDKKQSLQQSYWIH